MKFMRICENFLRIYPSFQELFTAGQARKLVNQNFYSFTFYIVTIVFSNYSIMPNDATYKRDKRLHRPTCLGLELRTTIISFYNIKCWLDSRLELVNSDIAYIM